MTARTSSLWPPRSERRRSSPSRSSTRSKSRVTNGYFLRAEYNAIRKAKGLDEVDLFEFDDIVKERLRLVDMDPGMLKRAVNSGFSGGEKKRNEILQMAVLKPAWLVDEQALIGSTSTRCAWSPMG